MRKLLLSACSLFILFTSMAQVSESDRALAMQLLQKNSAAIGLSAADLDNSIVANTYAIPGRNDLRMVYLQQSFSGLPVFNELQVLAFRVDKLASLAGSRIAGIEKKTNTADAQPAIPAQEAVRFALADARLQVPANIQPLQVPEPGRKYEFGQLGVALENITAELLWFPVDEHKQELRLAWQVFLVPNNSDAYWLVRIDAMNGNVLGKQNLTITCNWDPVDHSVAEHVSKNHIPRPQGNLVAQRPNQESREYRPFLINSASYRCIPYPAESPTHLGAPSGVALSPWQMAPGNASTLGWHNDGTNDHDSTRGNNVWAAEDRAASNGSIDRAAVSTTPGPNLTFDYNPDYSVAPTLTSPPNQQFAITNLFYWNNIMHDISYIYGFTETAGNFQNSNMGRGGNGNDYVIADAQDGGSTNNANFATPVDGTRPRMQMYLWTAPNPDRDGDLDNGIIAHEYTHGISNRLTGGPSNSSCLGNAEHGGEGWSDYFALMLTTNWSTATINDGLIPRGVGTYVRNQSPAGSGIRNFRYCTDMAVNPLVYSSSLPTSSHDRGEYWCMALWEMTWELVQMSGINPNLFNPAAGGGNAVALKLVTEGMRLQPCNPGFIDARNAILKADTLFYGAQYSCAIWKAFAKRGMGRTASQGSSGSVTDQVPSFLTDNGILALTQSVQQVQEGNNVTYNNYVAAGICSPLSNAFITDTLPTTVTWLSGGLYNAANRTVTFGPINLASAQGQNHSFTVSVNNGTYFTPTTHFNETVPNASIPASWTASSTSAVLWTTSNLQSNSSPNSFFAPDPDVLSDHQLATTASFTLSAAASAYTTLSFWHRFNTEDGWDGGVVEISTNGGLSWIDLGSKMIQNGYNGSLGSGSGNVLAGRQAFTGLTNAFVKTVINLSSYAGQSVRIRFRFATDDNTAPLGGGWFVDDIVLYTEPMVYIRSNLFNSSNALLSRTDTITRILPNASCTPASITTQPTGVTECSGNNAVFSVTAGGTAALGYQWQINTGSGFADVSNALPYAGTNAATMTITGVTAGMNGYQYRCIVTNSCGSVISDAVTLTVTAVATIAAQPVNSTGCAGSNTTFTVNASGATAYQWQVNSGAGFTDITNAAPYSGVNTATLSITGITSGMNNYQYRCVLSSCGPGITTDAASLIVAAPAVINTQPVNSTVCQGANTSFSINAGGTVTGYQWQQSTDGGVTFTNINGQTNAVLNLNAVTTAQSGTLYRNVVSGNCGNLNSGTAMLTVNPTPVITLGNIPASRCFSDTAFTLTASLPGGTWSGNGVQGNMFLPSTTGFGIATVTYTVTNSAGCTAAQSANIQINECPERHLALNNPQSLIIYPNPNNGQFSIRVRTDLYTRFAMKVYAGDGKLVAEQEFSGLYYDRVLPVDLTRLAGGVYHLLIYNNDNGKLSKRTVSLLILR